MTSQHPYRCWNCGKDGECWDERHFDCWDRKTGALCGGYVRGYFKCVACGTFWVDDDQPDDTSECWCEDDNMPGEDEDEDEYGDWDEQFIPEADDPGDGWDDETGLFIGDYPKDE